MADLDELSVLRTENARLIALLEANGIEWRVQQPAVAAPAEDTLRLSTADKVALFRRFFAGGRMSLHCAGKVKQQASPVMRRPAPMSGGLVSVKNHASSAVNASTACYFRYLMP